MSTPFSSIISTQCRPVAACATWECLFCPSIGRRITERFVECSCSGICIFDNKQLYMQLCIVTTVLILPKMKARVLRPALLVTVIHITSNASFLGRHMNSPHRGYWGPRVRWTNYFIWPLSKWLRERRPIVPPRLGSWLSALRMWIQSWMWSPIVVIVQASSK